MAEHMCIPTMHSIILAGTYSLGQTVKYILVNPQDYTNRL